MDNFILQDIAHVEKVRLLQMSNWGSNLAPVQIDQLAKYFTLYKVAVNGFIMEEAKPNDIFCIVCAGQVDVIKAKGTAKERLLATLGIGKALGEMSFFDEQPCSATLIVKEEATLLVIDKKTFDLLCRQLPEISYKICISLIKNLSQRLRMTTNALVDEI